MRVVLALALGLVGCRQILGLEDLRTDAGTGDGIHMNDSDASDAPLSGPDRDHDNIADDVDNCPDKANTDQANEDGDKFGDVCDPCPIEMNDTPSDPDGDGVADGCDPHPNTAGDSLAVFEGFKSGVPATWQSIGSVVAGSNEASLTFSQNNHEAIVPPVGPLGNATISASVIIDQLGTNGSSSSITLPYNATTDDGIFCELDEDPTQGNKHLMNIYDTHANGGMGQNVSTNNYSWVTAVAQKMVFTRSGNGYTCTVTPAGGTAHTTNGSTGNGGSLGAAQAAVAMYNSGARVQWLMIVASP